MRMSIGVAFGIAGIIFAGAAIGQGDPLAAIAARQVLMKANNASARAAFQMVKGTTPYDATAAAAAMTEIATDMETFPTLFPPGSDQGAKTLASPDIFTNMDDFKALAAQLATDAKAAAAAAPNGVDAFKTAFFTVNDDCSACHKKYRTE